MNIKRIEKLIGDAIDTYNLDLSGLTVFTEAASGNYVVTPLIAALAGSDRFLQLHGTLGTAKQLMCGISHLN